MIKKKKYLFITHDASLSGAPVLLLNLLSILKTDGKIEIRIIIKRDGELTNQFKKVAPVRVIKTFDYLKGSLAKKINDLFNSKLNILKSFYWSLSSDIIFSNTITNGNLLSALFKRYVITYVHELSAVANLFKKSGDLNNTLKMTNIFLCPSLAVIKFLNNEMQIPLNKCKLFPYYFPFDKYKYNVDKPLLKQSFCDLHNLNVNSKLIVSMGTICNRKGYDIFLDICRETEIKYPGKFSFIWIGKPENNEIEQEIKSILKSELFKNVRFIGPVSHDYTTLLAFDIFLLASREDPYPLVVLEAAFQNLPTIAFAKSGGIPEFIEKDAGWIIPEFNIFEAVKLITSITDEEIIAKGNNAKQKVLKRHGNKASVLNYFSTATY